MCAHCSSQAGGDRPPCVPVLFPASVGLPSCLEPSTLAVTVLATATSILLRYQTARQGQGRGHGQRVQGPGPSTDAGISISYLPQNQKKSFPLRRLFRHTTTTQHVKVRQMCDSPAILAISPQIVDCLFWLLQCHVAPTRPYGPRRLNLSSSSFLGSLQPLSRMRPGCYLQATRLGKQQCQPSVTQISSHTGPGVGQRVWCHGGRYQVRPQMLL